MKRLLLLIFLLLSYSGFSQTILMQDGTFNTCTGTFTDSGGTTGAYSGNEDFTITLCSDIPGLGIELDFTVFNLGPVTATPDTMTIYDGPDTASPIIGVYTGFTSPGFVEATGPTGCLTIRFQSDIAISGPGWEADISCCQIINASFDSSTPPPDGMGFIVVDALDIITFNGSATFSLDGTGATYLWDFGDGATDTGTTVNHAYALDGVYTVTYTVIDTAGCTSVPIEITVVVGNGVLQASQEGDAAFARGSFVEIGIQDNGAFGASNTLVPAGYHPSRETGNNLFGYIANPMMDGWIDYDGDYFTPGTPEEGFGIQIDGINYNNNTTGDLTEIPGSVISAGIETDPCTGNVAVINWEGIVDEVRIERQTIVTQFGLFIQMTTTLTNTGTTAKDGIFFMQNVDPDNNQTINGSFTTDQLILQQASSPADPIAFVCAFQDPMGGVDATGSNVCMYANDSRARVTFGGFSNRNPADIWNGVGFTQAEGATNTADEAISVAVNIGRLDPGETTSMTYYYVFSDFTGTGVFDPTSIRVEATDPTACGASDGFITISGVIASTDYDVTYDDDGVPVGPITITANAFGQVIISGLNAGLYNNITLSNAAGCNYANPEDFILTDPGAAVFAVTPTDPTSCVADGMIEITGLSPSVAYEVTYTVDGVVVGPVTYTSGVSGTILITGLDQGTYTAITVGIGGCNSVDAGPYILAYPTLSAFTVATTDPPTCTADGVLTIGGLNVGEMYDITYTVDGVVVGPVTYTADGAGNIVLIGLDAGTYTDVTVFQAGCSIVDSGPYIISYPPITFTVSTVDPSMCDASGSLILDGLVASTTYQVTYTVDGVVIGPTGYTSDATGQIIIPGLVAGTYTDIMLEFSTCSGMDPGPYVLTNPAVAFAVAASDPTMCDDSGSLTISGLFPSDTVQVTYTLDGVVVGPVAYTTDGTGAFIITGLVAGTYTDITIVTGSCTVVDPGPYVLANPAFSFTTATQDPALCDDSGSITLSGLFPSDTVQVTYTVDGVVVGPVAFTTDATGELIIIGLVSGTYTDITVVSGSCSFVDPGPYVLTDIALDITVSARDATTCGPTGQITISNLLPGVTYDVSYVIDGVPVAAAPYTADGSGIIVVTGLIDGTYTDVTVTLNSCTDAEPGPFVIGLPPNPVPVDPTPYRLCDDGVADGFTEFDLTVKIPEITAGDTDLAVSFHLTLADADAGAPALPALYTNVMNPQTVYVRVESVTTGCYATTTLELEVLDAPAAVTPTPLEYCDPDNDGFG
ncbi:MAG: PKD domain-containing protein, partial [Gilvibacter sp.]